MSKTCKICEYNQLREEAFLALESKQFKQAKRFLLYSEAKLERIENVSKLQFLHLCSEEHRQQAIEFRMYKFKLHKEDITERAQEVQNTRQTICNLTVRLQNLLLTENQRNRLEQEKCRQKILLSRRMSRLNYIVHKSLKK